MRKRQAKESKKFKLRVRARVLIADFAIKQSRKEKFVLLILA